MADSIGIDCFFFEVFDEEWKGLQGEGEVGKHWGLYYSNGSPKPLMVDLLPDSAQEGITRPERAVDTTEAELPLYVYYDGCDTLNGFRPSGWMGELEQFAENDTTSGDPTEVLYELHTENPYSGETCTRISYTPSPGQWGGIYWQFPVNNWGLYPGYDLSASTNGSDSVKLTFRVRGHTGGERGEFKTGGIRAPGLGNWDSYGPISTGVIILSTQWEEYSLDLTGRDLSSVIGGFVWVTNYSQNPQGATIYLDDIAFETLTPTGVWEEISTTPTDYSLSQNYPNPFNLITEISFSLPAASHVKLEIFNVMGQKVATVADRHLEAGNRSVTWDGSQVASGVYLYRLTAGDSVESKKMVLLK